MTLGIPLSVLIMPCHRLLYLLPPLLPLRMETDRREIGRNRKRDGANTISVHNRYGPLPAAGTERPLQKSVQIKKKIRAG